MRREPAASAGIAPWLEHLRSERRLAARSVAAYQRNIEILLAHCAAAQTTLMQLSGPGLRRIAADLHRSGWSARTLAQWLASVRGYYRFALSRLGYLQDPTRGLRPPKSARKLPEVLDVDEAQQLVELDTTGRLGVRDRALLEVVYGMGLRVGELVQLRWDGVDLEQAEARVLGKGARTRIAPIGQQAAAALAALRAEQTDHSSFVFQGRNGALSVRAVQLRLRTLAARQGIWKRVYPHLLRHSFASHVLESSGDLRGVQELLGHANLQTTQIYTHLDFQHLAKVYDQAHPRAQRKKERS